MQSPIGGHMRERLFNGLSLHLEGPARKGISLVGLRKLGDKIAQLCTQGFFMLPYEVRQPNGKAEKKPGSASTIYELTICQLVFAWITTQTEPTQCLADKPAWIDTEDIGPPTYYISHVWDDTVGHLLEGIESYMATVPDGTCIWIDFIAMPVHRQQALEPAVIQAVLRACQGGTIAVVDVDADGLETCPTRCAWSMFVWEQTLNIHGTDGLHVVSVTSTDWDRLIRSIDIEQCECVIHGEKHLILDAVKKLHGSCLAFNQTLSLQLLLRPLSYSVDLDQLVRRSEGTAWRWDPILEWQAKAPDENRALCVMAGAGTGKSTITAAISAKLAESGGRLAGTDGPDDSQPPVLWAHHFLKYNDQRRLEPLRILQSLAFQLASRSQLGLPRSSDDSTLQFTQRLLEMGYYAACEMDSLARLFTTIKSPVYILIDALDEGDPPEQVPGFSGTVLACGNKAVQLITRDLSTLPPNFRFIFTTRPDALCYGIEATLSRSFIGLDILQPWELRQGEDGSAMGHHQRVLVYETVVKECLGGEEPPLLSAGEVLDETMLPLYSAYLQTFSSSDQLAGAASKEDIMPLMQVLMAAQEPLSRSHIQRMGMLPLLESLPGWGVLFYLADHYVYQLHKSLRDWLLDPVASHGYHVDNGAGHFLLGEYLMHEVLQCTKEHPPSLYALNYVFDHLAGASSNCSFLEGVAHADMGGTHHAAISHIEVSEMLDAALQRWEFLHHVFQGVASAANMVRALGNIPRHERSMYTDDSFLWARRLYHDLMARPANMEKVTISGCPIKTLKYKEALELVNPDWVTCTVFGGSGGEWPPDQAILKGHTDWLYSLAYSPDGRQLASSSKDGTIWLWDLANGQIRAKLEGHNGTVLSVTFNPNGRQLASSGDDRSVHLWDLASGMCTAVLRNHTSWVYRVAYSPDGMQLASAGCDRTIKLWDVASESCTRTLEGHSDFVYGICYSPGGNVIASASKDESIRVWDPATGDCTMVLRGHTKEVFSVAFRSDGSLLGSASYDRTVKLWDMTSGQCVRTLSGHMNIVLSISFSPDMTQLASTGSDLTLKLWSLDSGECVDTFLGHTDACFSVAYSPDGTQLASASADRTVRLWDLSRASLVEGHTSWIHSVAYSPSGTWLASCSRDETVKLWDVESGRCTATLRGHTDVVHCVCIHPRGELLVSASLDHTLRMWDLGSASLDASLELAGHTNGAICVSFSPDGKHLASGSMDSTVKLWELERGVCVGTLSGHHNTVWSVVFHPDGKSIATAAADNEIKIWLIETQECVATLQGHTHHVIWLDFRSDGKQLASSSSDNTVRLWDMEAVMKYVERRKPALPNIKLDTNASETNSDRGSNKQGSGSDTTTSYNNSNKNNEKSNANANSDANNIPHAYNNANNANANNDANNIANANNNANNANGNADGNSAYHSFHSSAMTLRGHTDFVHSISYSPDGMRLASGSKDKAVMVWDTETGESLATLQGHSGWVYSVVYSPDGKLIASSSADGTLRLWAQSDSI